ncbi:ABC transporter ATP-binding protein [soil metagenome]
MNAIAPVLDVRDLTVRIRTDRGSFVVVDGVSLSVMPGETLCLVGEGGCGKTMTALSLLRLQPEEAEIVGGTIGIEGRDLRTLSRHDVEDLRGSRIAMIFQEPLTSLNPVMTIGDQIAEGVRRHRKVGRAKAHARALEMLRLVGIPDPVRRARQHAHELSGGQRQRAMIAVAMACDPRVLIADEPTTALDVTIQAQILDLMRDLQNRLGTALVLITHDFGIVAEMADRVVVMYAGREVEEGPVGAIFDRPLHPYTRMLMAAAPKVAESTEERAKLANIPGTVAALFDLPRGCAFEPRCPLAMEVCGIKRPPYEVKESGHRAACFAVAAAGMGVGDAARC